ncbi:MAG: ATP phosphoribosyltransferase regulatory subunit [Candidatus Nanohaloarchaea archaeon]|nr:ATP phosphoribosyltransferase regulatory subunit [Candidatus Nanohaloarchaea archaeon]
MWKDNEREPAKLPRGFDFETGRNLRRKRELESLFRDVAERHGAEEILTPTVHPRSYYDVDKIKKEEFIKADIRDYKEDEFEEFREIGRHEAFLKPEETAAASALVAKKVTKGDWEGESRFHYTSRFFRNGGAAGRGEKREFSLSGFELFGDGSARADAELMAIPAVFLEEAGFDSRVRFSDARIFHGLEQELTSSSEIESIDVIHIFELIHSAAAKKAESSNTRGDIEAVSEILDEAGVEGEKADFVKSLVDITGVGEFKSRLPDEMENHQMELAVKNMERLENLSEATDTETVFDPGTLKGISYYYSGTIFEIDLLKNVDVTAGIGTGGRYDDQVSKYLEGAEVPAAGLSIAMDRLAGEIDLEDNRPRTYLVRGESKSALKKVQQLRREGKRALILSENLDKDSFENFKVLDLDH